MNPEETVKAFLALFHTRKLDVAAVRALLADDARYQPIVPIAPVRRARMQSARNSNASMNCMTNAPAISSPSRRPDLPFSLNALIAVVS